MISCQLHVRRILLATHPSVQFFWSDTTLCEHANNVCRARICFLMPCCRKRNLKVILASEVPTKWWGVIICLYILVLSLDTWAPSAAHWYQPQLHIVRLQKKEEEEEKKQSVCFCENSSLRGMVWCSCVHWSAAVCRLACCWLGVQSWAWWWGLQNLGAEEFYAWMAVNSNYGAGHVMG